MQIPNIYTKPYYKYYVLIPIVIGIIAFLQLPNLRYGIDLRGGARITANLEKDISIPHLESFLLKYKLEDVGIKFTENPLTGRRGLIIEFAGNSDLIEAEKIVYTNPEKSKSLSEPYITSTTLEQNASAERYLEVAKTDFNSKLQKEIAAHLEIKSDEAGFTEIGASLGEQFWRTSQNALIIAFFLITIIVFILFREPIPILAVIQAALYDVLIALAGMAVFRIPLTLPTIAALLMILGHSVDTDILTANRVLTRKEGNPAERTMGAMITGMTITGTLLIVLLVLVIFSYLNQMTTIFQIASVLLFGLLGDLPSTWFTNAVMIKWWAERKLKSS